MAMARYILRLSLFGSWFLGLWRGASSRLPPPLSSSLEDVVTAHDREEEARRNNARPVVGVFVQRTDTAPRGADEATLSELRGHRFYLPASYVSWIGQAGGRVLPVLLDQPRSYYEGVFNVTSGLLFPGGAQGIGPETAYEEEGAILWNLAKASNDAGSAYPIWGTCLGFQEMAILETGDGSVINRDVRATNAAMSLDIVPGAYDRSRFLRSLPPQVVSDLGSKNVTFNYHVHGILADEFNANARLRSFFRPISYNAIPGDDRGRSFVSTMEARDYPFYGVQWHPEKNNFEWSMADGHYSEIPHTAAAVAVSAATAHFFLGETRRCTHVFPEERRNDLVYSATMVYSGGDGWAFQQIYVF